METKKQKKTIALICDQDAMSAYEYEIIKGMSQYALEKRNFVLQLFGTDAIKQDACALKHCDGIVFAAFFQQKFAKPIKATGLPVIDLSGEADVAPDIVSVDADAQKIGAMAAEWFMRRGFKSFAYYGIQNKRYCEVQGNSFADTLADAGYACNTFRSKPPSSAKGDVRLEKWVKTLPPRTAVFCVNDSRARKLMQTCLKAGIAVPDDIAIMGTGNEVTICAFAPVPVSSIDPNYHGIGYAAMRIMDSLLKNPVGPKQRPVFRVSPSSVVLRESTAGYPVDPPWLARLLETIDANLHLPLLMPQLATAAGMSQTTLQTAFHRAFGMSASKYVMYVKMREANRLFEAGTTSVKDVAKLTGFSSTSYFCHAYRAYYGHAPLSD